MKSVVIVTNLVTKCEHAFPTITAAANDCGVDPARLFYVIGKKDQAWSSPEWFIRRLQILR